MNLTDIPCGQTTTVDLKPGSAPDFGRSFAGHPEATLQFSEVTGDSLLRVGDDAWAVDGADARSTSALRRLRERNLPRIVWVAAARPKGQPTTAVLVQVHEFPASFDWPEPLDIGVDEKLVDQLRQKLGRAIGADEATRWLNERFLIPAADGLSRVFLSGSPTPDAHRRTAFRLYGSGYAVDVTKGSDETLLATRIVEAKRPRQPDERRPIVLARGRIGFCDATIAGAYRGTARTQLDHLVERAGSYLSLWREYNGLERESILRRARALGWLRYDNAQPRGDGRWRFQVDAGQLEAAIGLMRGMEDVDLEAASQPPPELQRTAPTEDAAEEPTLARARRERVFVGALASTDVTRGWIDLQAPVEEEERRPPETGVLFLSMSGDRRRLDRRTEAQSRIAAAECPMPQLGLLIEGSAVPERRRRTEAPLSAAARAVFGGEPTARQVEALRVALNTPDIALIQGPPGTGKTRTIAALEARLAEISEDGLAGQTLLTSYQHDAVENAAAKTLVFGLPAIKVGRKRGTTDEGDGFDRWRRERIAAVHADLARLPERPVTDVLRRVRALGAAYVASPITDDASQRVAREVHELARAHLPPTLVDRLETLLQDLARPVRAVEGVDADDHALLVKAVRSLRTDPVSFEDDGARNAARALLRLQSMGLYDSRQHAVIGEAAAWAHETSPPFLEALAAVQDALLDRLSAQRLPGPPAVNADLEALLPEIADALHDRARESPGGEDSVLHAYLDDLERDIDGVREAVRAYTVVLAATCQQSVGFQMSQLKGDDPFDTVIVDEAARSNPLDLFIPMSRAERRIILVGDHRQLPHILEPDIEAQLEQSIDASTQIALRRSLFQRLFESMKEREARDGFPRTVTLDQQFRMHPVLGAFVSETFYAPYGEGFASPRPAGDFVHDLPGYPDCVAAWVNMPMSSGREQGGQSKRRPVEAEWIAREVQRLATVRRDLSFGVISFYSAQVDEVLRAFEKRGMAERLEDGSYRVNDAWRETAAADGRLIERLRVGTVDAFQGKEFDVVILSMTRSNDLPATDERSLRRKLGHLMLENRLCVAMSRQQRLLIVVGDAAMLKGDACRKAVPGLVAFRELCAGRHGHVVSA